MKRVIIICEGETEKEFVETTLQKYFSSKNIILNAPLIKKSNGGIVKWKYLKKQIETHLKSEKDSIVTTLIDYYGLYEKYHFPNWENAHKKSNKNDILKEVESSMLLDIEETFRHRFVPYLQLHEFEGLIFSDKDELLNQIPQNDILDFEELDDIFEKYTNPEEINNSKETAPSKRLLRIINGYNKIVYGNIIAEAIGVDKIRSKAIRFNKWLNIIENKILN